LLVQRVSLAMPIRAFLDGEVFDPEIIQVMNKALADAREALRLKEKDDEVNRLLAMRIIDHARDGIHDAELLKAAALKGFK
jgi:urease gamma subunit